MKQNAQFNDILNICLDRLFRGETVERCLQDYPEYAKELEPLLRTAKAARVVSEMQPRPDFKAQARYEFQAELNAQVAKKDRKSTFNWFPHWRWQSGWAAVLAVFLVVVLGGGGTVAAASASMPDSPLYSLKLATENGELAVTFSDVGKAELNARFANRRTAEIGYLAAKGDAQDVQMIAQRLDTNLTNITQITAMNITHATADLNATPVNGADQGGGTQAETSGMNRNNSLPTQNTLAPTIAVAPTPPSIMGAPAAPPTGVAPQTGATAPDNSEKAAAPVLTPQEGVPAITIPPVSVVVPAPAGNGASFGASSESTSGGGVTLTAEGEKLQKIIEDNYQERQAELQKILDSAPAAVRPAIRQAIARSQAQYEQEINNLAAGFLAK